MNLQNAFRKMAAMAMALVMAGTVLPASANESLEGTTVYIENGSGPTTQVSQRQGVALYKDEDVVRVSIFLEKPATTENYSSQAISTNASAKAYRSSLVSDQKALETRISKDVLGGEGLDVAWNLTLSANLISAYVPYGKIAEIKKMAGVKDVVLEAFYDAPIGNTPEQPMMIDAGPMIHAGVAYASGYTGAGSTVAVIDTGTDLDHQSFDEGAYLYAMEEEAKAAGMTLEEYQEAMGVMTKEHVEEALPGLNAYQKNSELTVDDVYRNSKLPFAYNYIDNNLDVTHDNDDQGSHGSHVAGIAAANRYIPAEDGYAKALDAVYVQGVAPEAQVLTMKVFGAKGGAYDSDYMAAMEDALYLGADASNLSLGSSEAGFTSAGEYEDIMNALVNAGMVVSISAGNAYSWADFTPYGYLYGDDINLDSVGLPASYNNALSVASINNRGLVSTYFTVSDVDVLYSTASNSVFSDIGKDVEYVVIPGFGAVEDYAGLEDAVAGRVALVSRGEITFADKATNAVNNGAIAVIIYNNTDGTIGMDLTGYTADAPVVSITQADGEWMIEAAEGNVGKLITHEDLVHVANDKNEMSDFSSWGPTNALVMKPEITAPGGNIYSINGVDKSGKAYEEMSGTSMASPQVAGMAALIKQYLHVNGLSEEFGVSERTLVNSLLMATAMPFIEEDAGSWYSVLKCGAGLADVGAALSAKAFILMSEDSVIDANSAIDGKVKAEFGDDPERTGVYSYRFTMHNMTGSDQMYTLASSAMTQDLFDWDGMVFLDTWTRPLGATVKYAIDGVTFTPQIHKEADVNKDGVTDKKDAEDVLAYVTGLEDGSQYDLDAADFDGNGEVTSYDAHQILASIENAFFTVPAEGSVDIDVEIALDEATKEMLDEQYANGAYVEGYTWIHPVGTEEGELDVEYSIPFLGFYGSFGDAGMYDKGGDYVDFLYDLDGDIERMDPYPYTAESMFEKTGNWLGNSIVIDGLYYQLNPYGVEDEKHVERAAINSASTVFYNVDLIRNAGAILAWAEDLEGNVISDSEIVYDTSARFYDPSYGWVEEVDGDLYLYGCQGAALNKDWASSLKEGDAVVFKTVSVPEYYTYGVAKEEITPSFVHALVDNGVLGEGAMLTSYPFTIDNEKPEVKTVEFIDNEDGTKKLRVVARDNRFLAGLVLVDFGPWFEMSLIERFKAVLSGKSMMDYAKIVEFQPDGATEIGAEKEYAFDVSEIVTTEDNLKYLGVFAADYAYNEVAHVFSNEVARRLSGDQTEEGYSTEEMIDALQKEGIAIPEKTRASGSLNAISTEKPDVEREQDIVVVNIDADGDTNCLSEITYDTTVLKLEGIASGQEISKIKEEDGKVVFAFANAMAVSDAVATLRFSYEPSYQDIETLVHVSTKEENDGTGEEEDVKVVIEAIPYEPSIEVIGEGKAELTGQTLNLKAAEGYTLESVSSDGEVVFAVEGEGVQKASDGRNDVSLEVSGEKIEVVYRMLDIEFIREDGMYYWYENGVRQGTQDDPKNIKDAQFANLARGREIYDPATDAWYWLDVLLDGAKATDKEVWIPYVYQDEKPGSTDGKWVRYDKDGQMIKGWYANDNGGYYYDLITGAMYKGTHVIEGKTYFFDEITGILH